MAFVSISFKILHGVTLSMSKEYKINLVLFLLRSTMQRRRAPLFPHAMWSVHDRVDHDQVHKQYLNA